MGANSNIEWCDHTFNPWVGCTKISPACDHCYAESWAKRAGHGELWHGQRRRTSAANWRQPLKWDRDARLLPWRQRVFCASLSDVFDNSAQPEWRIELFGLIERTPSLDWLLLTKRIGNAAEMMGDATAGAGLVRIPENVWLGATVCDQEEADRDIPKLLATPAATRFLSIEPMLGPIDLHLGWNNDTGRWDSRGRPLPLRRIDWVICGGESGPHARPMHPDWVRSLRDQCAEAGVPFFFKQWGTWVVASVANGHHDCAMATNSAHWVFPDGRMQKPSSTRPGWAGGDPYAMVRSGKKRAGRLLDGKLHDGFPNIDEVAK